MSGDPLDRCRALVEIRRHREAVAGLAAVLAEDPEDAEALTLLSVAHLGTGDHAAALRAGNLAVVAAPEGEWGHQLCAMALDALGQHDEACRAARTAVRLAPQLWETHVTLASVSSARPTHLPGARRSAEQAVRLAPDQPETHFILGYVAQQQAQREVARRAYERTLALEPGHATALNNLTALSDSRRLGPAAKGYGAALQMDPQQATARRNIDVLLGRLMIRLYYAGLVGYLGALAVAYAGQGGSPRVSRVSAVWGGLLVLAVVAYLWSLRRSVPLGVRRYAVRSLATADRTTARGALAAVLIVLALSTCWVPGAAVVASRSFHAILLANVVLVIVSRASPRP